MLAKLWQSRIDEKTAEKLNLQRMMPNYVATKTNNFFDAFAMRLPYWDEDAKVNDYYRMRILVEPPPNKQKYWGIGNYPPQIYMPPLLKNGRTWRDIIKEKDGPPEKLTRIYVTEGELKAICAMLYGLPCLGIGGVYSYGSKKRGQLLVPTLEQFACKDREFVIVYDSDAYRRADLVGSLYMIKERLGAFGCRVYHIDLPPDPSGEKVGLDDYVVKSGIKALLALPLLEFDLTAELARLNTEYTYAQTPGCIVRRRDSFIQTKTMFELDTANRSFVAWTREGPMKMSASHEWLIWKTRDEVIAIVYQPRRWGDERHPDNLFNTWTGWGAAPVQYDEDRNLFLKLIDHLCARSEPHMKEWLLQWLAYPIQNPGAKIMSAPVFHGVQGGGKTMLGYLMREVYGWGNFAEITQEMLDSDFNPYAASQFIMGDELVSSDRRHNRNKTKQLVTRGTVSINDKHKPRYDIVDCANYLFTSNDPTPISLEDGDRRFGIFTVSNKLPQYLRALVGAMYKSERGRNAIMWCLLNEVDCKDFDIYADAPMSAAKADMLFDAKTHVEQFIMRGVIEQYEETFAVLGTPTKHDFQTTETIVALYNLKFPEQPPTNTKIVGGILAKLAANTQLIARIPQFQAAKPFEDKTWIRAWAFRSVKRWRRPGVTSTDAKVYWDALVAGLTAADAKEAADRARKNGVSLITDSKKFKLSENQKAEGQSE